jgi:hypothetical protein
MMKIYGVRIGLTETTDVITRAKHRPRLAIGVGGQHQHPNILVVIHSFKVRKQGSKVLIFKPIAVGGSVERDGGHTIVDMKHWRIGGICHEVLCSRKLEIVGIIEQLGMGDNRLEDPLPSLQHSCPPKLPPNPFCPAIWNTAAW